MSTKKGFLSRDTRVEGCRRDSRKGSRGRVRRQVEGFWRCGFKDGGPREGMRVQAVQRMNEQPRKQGVQPTELW